ncbi:hypothetical protein [Aquirufa sp.]|jgi:hypothetical protein|uniref:hypothetical protein n=1 Tax=Aquirufa sp. TaxID=2676249 RepID=UPI0037BFC2EE
MRNNLRILLMALFVWACNAKTDEPMVTPAVPEKAPDAVELSKPANNTVCLLGTNTSGNEVQFTWAPVASATSYDLKITNLITNFTETKSFPTSPANVTLITGVAYEWQVISKSNKSALTTGSAKWKFYLSGAGQSSYAPFPASLTFPASGQQVTATAGQVKLTWSGSDPDSGNSFLSYEVFVDTDIAKVKNREVTAQKIKTESLSIPVKSAATYYWMVKTTDETASSSYSAIYGFRVN